MKIRVNYKIEGTYTVDTSEFLEKEDEEKSEEQQIELAKEVIEDEPFVDVDPVADGKVTLEIIKA